MSTAPIPYADAKALFVAWCKRQAYDETDSELWDAYLAGLIAAEAHHEIDLESPHES